MVFGLGTRLRVHMRTKLENGVLHNKQQSQCCEWLLLTRVSLKLSAIYKALSLHLFTLQLQTNVKTKDEAL